MNDELDELLSFVSDEEMDHIAGQYGTLEGMQRVIQLAVERASNSEVRKIKDMLDVRMYGNRVPQEVKDYINTARAKFMYENRGMTFQMAGEDDRLGENMDNALIHLGYWKEGDDIRASGQRLQDDMLSDGEEHSSIGSILMRTIPETLKILIFYLKIKDIREIKKIVHGYEIWLQKMGHASDRNYGYLDSNQRDLESQATYRRVLGYDSYFLRHFQEVKRDFVTVSEDISRSSILWYIKRFEISDIDTFVELLFGEVYNYGFLLLADARLVEYFLDANKVTSLEQFQEFLKDEDYRNVLISFSQQSGGVRNLIKFLNRFDVKEPVILGSLDTNLKQALIKAKPENLDILFGIFGIKSQEELVQLLGNELIQRSIESVEYSPIWELVWKDEIFNIASEDKSRIFFGILAKGITQELSEGIKRLNLGIKKIGHCPMGLGEVLLKIFEGTDVIENIFALSELIAASGVQQNGNLDFSKLLPLFDFLDGVITPHLGREILVSEKPSETLLIEWGGIIGSFEQGKFDSSNELHRNLEYRKFRKLSTNEVLRKYMGRHFGIEAFLSIFQEEVDDNYSERKLSHEESEFELRCLIYEASILKDQILAINEIAKREGRKVVVVPNLSYGYLPVSVIADELGDPNIDIYYGAKVGSTEAHHDRDVINSALLIDIRDRFVTDQPILIVVDGTANIRTGNVRNIKYPDAYEGYLNQMIAWNYLQGLDDPEKVDYSVFGKTEEDIRRLFANEEFQRTVDIYKFSGVKPAMPYKMLFYNTGGLDLTIRDDSSNNGKKVPRKFFLTDVRGPSVIFCNVGILHAQLPEELKNEKFEHAPAYFDDSGRIIALEYTFDECGLGIINPIEGKIARMKGDATGKVKPKILR